MSYEYRGCLKTMEYEYNENIVFLWNNSDPLLLAPSPSFIGLYGGSLWWCDLRCGSGAFMMVLIPLIPLRFVFTCRARSVGLPYFG